MQVYFEESTQEDIPSTKALLCSISGMFSVDQRSPSTWSGEQGGKEKSQKRRSQM